MDVLVDYYNLSQRLRRDSIISVVDRITSALVPLYLPSDERRIDIRLYGGWYDDQTPTRDAQSISKTLRGHFPSLIYAAPEKRSIVVNADLAYSIKSDPAHHLWYTLRSKAAPRGIDFLDPASVGCAFPDRCPLRPGYDFFVRGDCIEDSCEVEAPLVVRRREQKLVDAMMAADVFFNAHLHEPKVAVVTSDDDLWPAIRTALQIGMSIVHVHTEKGRSTKAHYVHGDSSGYIQINLLEGAG